MLPFCVSTDVMLQRFHFFLTVSAGSPPSSPVNVHAVYRNSSFIITWDVPPLTYGTITEYVLYAIILPETRQTIYRSDIPMIIIGND